MNARSRSRYSGNSTDVQLVLSEDTDIRFTPDAPPPSQDLPLARLSAMPLGAGGQGAVVIRAELLGPGGEVVRETSVTLYLSGVRTENRIFLAMVRR